MNLGLLAIILIFVETIGLVLFGITYPRERRGNKYYYYCHLLPDLRTIYNSDNSDPKWECINPSFCSGESWDRRRL